MMFHLQVAFCLTFRCGGDPVHRSRDCFYLPYHHFTLLLIYIHYMVQTMNPQQRSLKASRWPHVHSMVSLRFRLTETELRGIRVMFVSPCARAREIKLSSPFKHVLSECCSCFYSDCGEWTIIKYTDMWVLSVCVWFAEAEGPVCSGQLWGGQRASGGQQPELWHSGAGQGEDPVHLQGQVWFPLQRSHQGRSYRSVADIS